MLTRGEEGSQEVTTFFIKELRLAPTIVCWQRRTLLYLRNRCRHRFCEEGAVCQAHRSGIARNGESREEKLVSLDGDVTEVMTLAVRHPVSSELCHHPRLGV